MKKAFILSLSLILLALLMVSCNIEPIIPPETEAPADDTNIPTETEKPTETEAPTEPPRDPDEMFTFEKNHGDSYTVTGLVDTSMTEFIFPAVYKDMPVTAIKEKAFMNCTVVESVKIPDSVTEVGESAFEGCKNLETVELSSSMTRLNKSTFYWCTSLTDITIPDSITHIAVMPDASSWENEIEILQLVKKIGFAMKATLDPETHDATLSKITESGL